jgi:hypothetical protein
MSPWLHILIGCVLIGACTSAPRSTGSEDLDRCLTRMRWLDRHEGDLAVWIDSNGSEHLIEDAVRSRSAREGDVEVEGRASPLCAARVRAYVSRLRAGRVQASDNGKDVLLW